MERAPSNDSLVEELRGELEQLRGMYEDLYDEVRAVRETADRVEQLHLTLRRDVTKLRHKTDPVSILGENT